MEAEAKVKMVVQMMGVLVVSESPQRRLRLVGADSWLEAG